MAKRRRRVSMRVFSLAVSVPVIAWTLPGVWGDLWPRSQVSLEDAVAAAARDKTSGLASAARLAAERCAGPEMPAKLKRFLADAFAETIRASAVGPAAGEDARQAKLGRKLDREFAALLETLTPAEQTKAAEALDQMTTGSTTKTGSACMLKAALKTLKRD